MGIKRRRKRVGRGEYPVAATARPEQSTEKPPLQVSFQCLAAAFRFQDRKGIGGQFTKKAASHHGALFDRVVIPISASIHSMDPSGLGKLIRRSCRIARSHDDAVRLTDDANGLYRCRSTIFLMLTVRVVNQC